MATSLEEIAFANAATRLANAYEELSVKIGDKFVTETTFAAFMAGMASSMYATVGDLIELQIGKDKEIRDMFDSMATDMKQLADSIATDIGFKK